VALAGALLIEAGRRLVTVTLARMSEETGRRHWHREPAPAMKAAFAEAAPFVPTRKGLQAAIEVIAYPAGHVQVVASRIDSV
jgi:hypothetical protein